MDKLKLKEMDGKHLTGKLQLKIYESHLDVPYHWHDEYEFICVTGGMCECIINGISQMVKKGQTLLVQNGELHTVNAGKTGSFFTVVFHPYICGNDGIDFFSPKINFRRIYDIKNTNEQKIIRNLEEIHKEYYNRYYGFELRLKALLIDIFADIYENCLYDMRNTHSSEKFAFFERILEYVHEHWNEKLSLNNIAEYSNFSKSYIIALFKKNTGKTPIDYINSYKIYRAKQMLKNSDKTILEICMDCGYDNLGYFMRVFKRHTMTTPYKYRNTYSS